MGNDEKDLASTIFRKIDETGILPSYLNSALDNSIYNGRTQEMIARELIGVFASEISEDILSSLMTNAWFYVGKKGGVSRITSNGAKRLINWGFAKTANIFNNSGYYGSFFESNILNMPTNIYAGPDASIMGTDTKLEIKTAVLGKAFRVIDKILNKVVKTSVFKGRMSVGGAQLNLNEKSPAQIQYEQLKKNKNAKEEDIKAAFVNIGATKIYDKMQSLLLAGVEVNTMKNQPYNFAYTQLIYFYDLIKENVTNMLAESVTMRMGTEGFNPKSTLIKRKGSAAGYKISIYMSRLGANDTKEEFAKRQDRLYRHKIEFFKNIENAKEFFEYVRNVKIGKA